MATSRLVIERAEPCRFWGILNPKLRGSNNHHVIMTSKLIGIDFGPVQNIKCVMGFSNKDSLYIDTILETLRITMHYY
jgi:hypothetical protein